jgi:hypothetical protein
MVLEFVLDLSPSVQAFEVSDSPTEYCGYMDSRLFNGLVSVTAIIYSRLIVVTLNTGMYKT